MLVPRVVQGDDVAVFSRADRDGFRRAVGIAIAGESLFLCLTIDHCIERSGFIFCFQHVDLVILLNVLNDIFQIAALGCFNINSDIRFDTILHRVSIAGLGKVGDICCLITANLLGHGDNLIARCGGEDHGGGAFTGVDGLGVGACFVIDCTVIDRAGDGVRLLRLAERCVVGHVIDNTWEVRFRCAGVLIGRSCPANEGIGVHVILCLRRVSLIKARLGVLFYIGICFICCFAILRLPGDREGRRRDFTGGDGEGDLYVRTLAVLDREGRFAVKGGVAVLCHYQIFVIRVDGDGVGFGVGVGGYQLLTFLFGHRFWMEVFYQIPFHACSFKGCRRDAGGQGILDGAGVQAGDDRLGDFCKFCVQLLCIVRIIGKLLTCFCRLRRNFSAQIFTDGNLAPVVRNINCLIRIKADGIELGTVLYCISRCNCLRKGFRIARITCSMYPILCITNRQKFLVKTP